MDSINLNGNLLSTNVNLLPLNSDIIFEILYKLSWDDLQNTIKSSKQFYNTYKKHQSLICKKHIENLLNKKIKNCDNIDILTGVCYKLHNKKFINQIKIFSNKWYLYNDNIIKLTMDLYLKCCASLGYLDVVKFLIENGADIHANYDVALYKSAQSGHLDVVKFLIENGANVSTWNDEALCDSAQNGHLDIVKFLIEKGANIHANDDPLRWSARNGHLDVVKLLIEYGANIHANDDEALYSSAKKGYLDIVKLLIEQDHVLDNWNKKSIEKVLEKFPNDFKIENGEIKLE